MRIPQDEKAVLKPPQSKRCRDYQAQSDLAKPLECDVFTAAFCAARRLMPANNKVSDDKRR